MDEAGAARLCLVISSLSAGGAERVMAWLAGEWVRRGHAVTLVTLASVADDFHSLDPRVRRVALDRMRPSPNPAAALVNNLRRVWCLRRAIRAAAVDAVVAFMPETNALVLLASRGLEAGVIVSERVDPGQHPIGRFWSWLRRVTYPLATSVVVQSDAVRRRLGAIVPKAHLTVIPNPVVPLERGDDAGVSLIDTAGAVSGRSTLVAVGRLTRQKGFDLLLQAFAEAVRTRPDWQLVVFGEGEERADLERLASSLQIDDRVFFPGSVPNLQALIGQAQLFALSSRYEGFPNALLEAMAAALPVIAFDCPCGPAEIVRDGVDGILVPAQNVAALGSAIARLMDDGALRARFSQKAVEVVERFSVERIMQRWDAVLTTAASRRGARAG